jgi:hypothetical protein
MGNAVASGPTGLSLTCGFTTQTEIHDFLNGDKHRGSSWLNVYDFSINIPCRIVLAKTFMNTVTKIRNFGTADLLINETFIPSRGMHRSKHGPKSKTIHNPSKTCELLPKGVNVFDYLYEMEKNCNPSVWYC